MAQAKGQAQDTKGASAITSDTTAAEQDSDADAWKTHVARKRLTDARITALVLGTEMVLCETTDEVVVTLRTPLDFEDSQGKQRLFAVRARETRVIGKRIFVHPGQSDEPIQHFVDGLVHRLTQAGKLHRGQYPGWEELPAELAKDLLSWRRPAP